ncbi:uncharacterized protein [Nicotiana tomentosiformis]|uniref:uncharacterized protein n=1 Tax=Nicotiana tomentosiformis TaxID=4098 RepID=UPI00388C455C
MLVHDYELFQMKEGESIEEMFARFGKIISDLKAFGEPYSSGDQVRKFLRSLPTTWKIKVVALESQDLNKLSYDELRGDRIAFEKTHIKKTVAFKATTERPENDIDDDVEALEEEIVMDILDLTLKESQKMLNELRRLNREKKDWELKLEVCEIESDVLLDEVEELQMQLNAMSKSTIHSSVKSNQATYKSTGKGPDRTESTSTNTNGRSKLDHPLCVITVTKLNINILSIYFINLIFRGRFENPKIILILVELTNKDPRKLGYLKESDNSVLQEHHRKSRKGQRYLDSACSCHMTGDKNLFKEVTKINGGSVKFGDDSKGKIVGTSTVPFNNNYDITEVYLVDGLNYNLLSISQLCDLGYEVKFKKAGCIIEDESSKIILLGKRYENVCILDGIENLDSHICLASIPDDPWLWHKKLGHASMHLIEKLSKHDLVIGLPKLDFFRNHFTDKWTCWIVFHNGGEWVKKPLVAYSRKIVHTKQGFDSDLLSYNDLVDEYISNLGYIGVQQLIVNGPSGTYYEIEGDYGIKTLLDFVNNQFNVINIFPVEECAPSINVPNIIHHNEHDEPHELEANTDCDESDNCDGNEYVVSSNYHSDRLEKLFTQKKGH